MSKFSIKINRLSSQSLMVGIMTNSCIDKRDVFNKKGFVALEASGKVWYDG